MNSETRAGFAERAQVLQALALPTRLYIVDVLSERERCPGRIRRGRRTA